MSGFTEVWVVTDENIHEGGYVQGVASTEDGARRLAQQRSDAWQAELRKPPTALVWRPGDPGGEENGGWWAERPGSPGSGSDFYNVKRWEVQS